MAMNGSDLIDNSVVQNLAEDAGKASKAIQLAKIGVEAVRHFCNDKGLTAEDGEKVNKVVDGIVDKYFQIDDKEKELLKDNEFKIEYAEFRQMLKDNMKVILEKTIVKDDKKQTKVVQPELVELTQTNEQQEILAENIANKADKKQVVPYKSKINAMIGEFDYYISDHTDGWFASTNKSGALMLAVKNMHILALRWMAKKSQTNGDKPRKIVRMVKRHLEEATVSAKTSYIAGRKRAGKYLGKEESEFQKALDRVKGQRNKLTVGILRCQASRSFESYLDVEAEETDNIEASVVYMGLRLLDKAAMASNYKDEIGYIEGGRFGPGAEKEINEYINALFKDLVLPMNSQHKWDLKRLMRQSVVVFEKLQNAIKDVQYGKIPLPEFLKKSGINENDARNLMVKILEAVSYTRIRRTFIRTIDNALRDNGEVAVCSQEEFEFIHMYLKYIDEGLDDAIYKLAKDKVVNQAVTDITTNESKEINKLKGQVGAVGKKDVYAAKDTFFMKSKQQIERSQNLLKDNSNNMIDYYERKDANTFNIYFRSTTVLSKKDIEQIKSLESIMVIQPEPNVKKYQLVYAGENGEPVFKDISSDNEKDKEFYGLVKYMDTKEKVFGKPKTPYSGRSYGRFIDEADAFVSRNNGYMHPEANKCNGSIQDFQGQVFALALLEVNNDFFGHDYDGNGGSKYVLDKYNDDGQHNISAQFKNPELENIRAKYLRASIGGLRKIQNALKELNDDFDLDEEYICEQELNGTTLFGVKNSYIKHDKNDFKANAISMNMAFIVDENTKKLIADDPFFSKFIVKDKNKTFKINEKTKVPKKNSKSNEFIEVDNVKEYPCYSLNFKAIQSEQDLLDANRLLMHIKKQGVNLTRNSSNLSKVKNSDIKSYTFGKSESSINAIDETYRYIEKFQAEKVETTKNMRQQLNVCQDVLSSTRQAHMNLRKDYIERSEELNKAKVELNNAKKLNQENLEIQSKMKKEIVMHQKNANDALDLMQSIVDDAKLKIEEYNNKDVPEFEGLDLDNDASLEDIKNIDKSAKTIDKHSKDLQKFREAVKKYKAFADDVLLDCLAAFRQLDKKIKGLKGDVNKHSEQQKEDLNIMETNSKNIKENLLKLEKRLEKLELANEKYKAQIKKMEQESIKNAPTLCEKDISNAKETHLQERKDPNKDRSWGDSKENYLRDIINLVNSYDFLTHEEQAKLCQALMDDEAKMVPSQRILTRRSWIRKDSQETNACKALKEVIYRYRENKPNGDKNEGPVMYYPNGASKGVALPPLKCHKFKKVKFEEPVDLEIVDDDHESNSNSAQNTNDMHERLGVTNSNHNDTTPTPIPQPSISIIGTNGTMADAPNSSSNDDIEVEQDKTPEPPKNDEIVNHI